MYISVSIHQKTGINYLMNWLMTFTIVLLSTSSMVVGPAYAQDAMTAREKAAAAKKAALKAREEAELRVEADMVTMNNLVEALAKNLGQMHYLRTLCFGDTDQKWRDFAAEMMSIEANSDIDEKRELIRAFNAGYFQEEGRHKECSRAVSADAAALAENGRHISSMLADPYRER